MAQSKTFQVDKLPQLKKCGQSPLLTFVGYIVRTRNEHNFKPLSSIYWI
jgi:hypothetical protein